MKFMTSMMIRGKQQQQHHIRVTSSLVIPIPTPYQMPSLDLWIPFPDVRTIERGEVRVEDIERGGHGVGNDLDRGRVDIVVDDRVTRTQTNNRNDHAGNRKATYQTQYWVQQWNADRQSLHHGHDMYHKSASNMTSMSDA